MMHRFMTGLAAGAAASAVTYAITTAAPWWWAIGLTAAVLVWCGDLILNDLL